MLSMVEMPKVIFSPDSAGMRKTNLRITDISRKTNLSDVFFSKFVHSFLISRPIVRVCKNGGHSLFVYYTQEAVHILSLQSSAKTLLHMTIMIMIKSYSASMLISTAGWM